MNIKIFIYFLSLFLRAAHCFTDDDGVIMQFSSCQDLKSKYIVEIDEINQELLLNKAELDCLISIVAAPSFNASHASCPATWDTISCWPETPLNKTVYLPCPSYINKFNTKNKAAKVCEFDSRTNTLNWSKTNYDECVKQITCNNTKCSIENHVKYITTFRIFGYVASMVSLALSIIILLRPKLRCPRNFVHINLFVAFGVRTILTILVDSFINVKFNNYIKLNASNEEKNDLDSIVPKFSFCKILVTAFYYSGSVYNVAISAEAFYLVLLLQFPFYSEKRGSIWCIILSWVLPILWMVPWIFVRYFLDDFWCWQTESKWNFITKIPHSILLVINVSFAIFIVRILYSKTFQTQIRNISQDKLQKYRHLAKSIFILIPVFGLHFIFFAWFPYVTVMNLKISTCLEIVVFYIETFFNAFLGLAVSITSCFRHSEVRIEFVVLMYELIKKIKCLNFLEPGYINQMRFSHNEKRYSSKTSKSEHHIDNRTPDVSIIQKKFNFEEEEGFIFHKKSLKHMRSKSADYINNEHENDYDTLSFRFKSNKKRVRFCNFLFGSQQFFYDSKTNLNKDDKKGNTKL